VPAEKRKSSTGKSEDALSSQILHTRDQVYDALALEPQTPSEIAKRLFKEHC
jgi:hypothetical protein